MIFNGLSLEVSSTVPTRLLFFLLLKSCRSLASPLDHSLPLLLPLSFFLPVLLIIPFLLVSLKIWFLSSSFSSFSWMTIFGSSQTSNNICCHTLKFPVKVMILNSAHWIISVQMSYIHFKPGAKLKHVFHFLPKSYLPRFVFTW